MNNFDHHTLAAIDRRIMNSTEPPVGGLEIMKSLRYIPKLSKIGLLVIPCIFMLFGCASTDSKMHLITSKANEIATLNHQWDSSYCTRMSYQSVDSQAIKKINLPDSLLVTYQIDSFDIKLNYYATIAFAQKNIACKGLDYNNSARIVLRDLLQVKNSTNKIISIKPDILTGIDGDLSRVLWFTMLENGACAHNRFSSKSCQDVIFRWNSYFSFGTSGVVKTEFLINGEPFIRQLEGWID